MGLATFEMKGKLIYHWIKYHLSCYSQDTDTIQIRGMVSCDYRNSLRVLGPCVPWVMGSNFPRSFRRIFLGRYWPHKLNKDAMLIHFDEYLSPIIPTPATCSTNPHYARSSDIRKYRLFCKSMGISVIFWDCLSHELLHILCIIVIHISLKIVIFPIKSLW